VVAANYRAMRHAAPAGGSATVSARGSKPPRRPGCRS
jgi:hypothetical protein